MNIQYQLLDGSDDILITNRSYITIHRIDNRYNNNKMQRDREEQKSEDDDDEDLISSEILDSISISDRSERSRSLSISTTNTTISTSIERENCLSIMTEATNTEQCQMECIKLENMRIKQENNNLRRKLKQMNGFHEEILKLDMEDLCDLEEKLMMSLQKVRRQREEYYLYYCCECESQQTYKLVNGCDCVALCYQCVEKKKNELDSNMCPNCEECFS